MKKTFCVSSALLLTVGFFVPGLNAQNSSIDYDLSSYKLPYLKRQVLEFDFYLSNYTSLRKQTLNTEDEDKSRNNQLRTNLNPTYYFYLNSEDLQVSHQISMDVPEIFRARQNNNTFSTKTSSIEPSFDYSGVIRPYFTDKFFLELDPQVNFSYFNSRTEDESKTDDGNLSGTLQLQSKILSTDLAVPVLIGYGRIEPVQDARLAIYILDDLKKAGRLKRDVSEEDITALAERVSEVLNERIFDNRERIIWQLEQINSILHEMDLITTSDMVYFNKLRDNLDFAKGPYRGSGFTISGGIAPEYIIDQEHRIRDQQSFDPDIIDHDDETRKVQRIGLGIPVKASFEKPINLYWQISVSNELKYAFYSDLDAMDFADNASTDTEEKFTASGIENSMQVLLGYYPNSRTTFQLSNLLTLSRYNSIPQEDDVDELKTMESGNYTSLNVYYYISPQLRLSVDATLRYNTRKYTGRLEANNRSLSSSYAMGLTYMLL
jgi:hypothetical protein